MYKRFTHTTDNASETVATLIHGYMKDRIDFEIITIAKDSGVQECMRVGVGTDGRIYGQDRVVGGAESFQGFRGDEDYISDPERAKKLYAIYDALKYESGVNDRGGKLDDRQAQTVRSVVTQTLEECFAKKWHKPFGDAHKWVNKLGEKDSGAALGRTNS